MLVIKNGKIVTMAERLIDGGDILVDNGKICDVSDSDEYEPKLSDTVINAENCFVFPGFVDIHTHCGLDGTLPGDIYRPELFIAPYVRTLRYINMDSESFSDRVSCGITSVLVAPFEDRIVGGKCCLLKTAAYDGKPSVVYEDCGISFSLAGMSDTNCTVTPYSVPYFIRDELRSAGEYLNGDMTQLESPSLSEYKSVLSGNTPAFFYVCNTGQIETAERIAKNFSLNAVMVLGEGNDAELTFCGTSPVVIDPSLSGNLSLKRTAHEIVKCNTDFAVSASAKDILSVNAGLLVRSGMDMSRAIAAITTTPARICGAEDRIGSLKTGADADIVVWNGNPLEVMSQVVYTVIDGRIVFRA